MDKSEIANIDYKEFMYSMSRGYRKSSKTYNSLLPEMTEYIKNVQHQFYLPISMEMYYYDSPYDLYPVTGITLEQIKKYSDWRSRKVFEMLLIENGYIDPLESVINDKKRLKLKDVVKKYSKDSRFDSISHYPLYYIPDSNEWNLVYEKCLSGEINIAQLNFKKSALKHQDITGLPLSPQKGFINNIKQEKVLYHLMGNVSELIAEEGYTAGGNYIQDQNKLLKSSNIRKEETPSVTVGFRNFCKWVEIKR